MVERMYLFFSLPYSGAVAGEETRGRQFCAGSRNGGLRARANGVGILASLSPSLVSSGAMGPGTLSVRRLGMAADAYRFSSSAERIAFSRYHYRRSGRDGRRRRGSVMPRGGGGWAALGVYGSGFRQAGRLSSPVRCRRWVWA